jgi:hypothetical protein
VRIARFCWPFARGAFGFVGEPVEETARAALGGDRALPGCAVGFEQRPGVSEFRGAAELVGLRLEL